MDFQFDPAKAAGIYVSTGCRLRTLKPCLRILSHCIVSIQSEERFVAIGAGSAGHLLVVVYTLRGEAVRLISVRRATPVEIRAYES